MNILKRIEMKYTKLFVYKNVKLRRNSEYYKAKISGFNRIGKGTIINFSNIGKMTYIGENCNLSNCNIGNFCSIGNNIKVAYGVHPVDEYFSTHPSFFSISKQSGTTFVSKNTYNERKLASNRYSVIIKNDVWIGDNVLILEGVTIGNGAILAAGAVVVRDVEDYQVVGGVPAKVIKKRFSEEVIKKLILSKWWDNDLTWFEDETNIKKLNNILD